jgi:hypothetical protein
MLSKMKEKRIESYGPLKYFCLELVGALRTTVSSTLHSQLSAAQCIALCREKNVRSFV